MIRTPIGGLDGSCASKPASDYLALAPNAHRGCNPRRTYHHSRVGANDRSRRRRIRGDIADRQRSRDTLAHQIAFVLASPLVRRWCDLARDRGWRFRLGKFLAHDTCAIPIGQCHVRRNADTEPCSGSRDSVAGRSATHRATNIIDCKSLSGRQRGGRGDAHTYRQAHAEANGKAHAETNAKADAKTNPEAHPEASIELSPVLRRRLPQGRHRRLRLRGRLREWPQLHRRPIPGGRIRRVRPRSRQRRYRLRVGDSDPTHLIRRGSWTAFVASGSDTGHGGLVAPPIMRARSAGVQS